MAKKGAANAREQTFRSTDPARFGPATRRYFDLMHRLVLADFLRVVSAIVPLIVITYPNEDWQPEWGGELRAWAARISWACGAD